MDPIRFYSSVDEQVLPDAARFPWDLVGAGGTLNSLGVRIAAVTARSGYEAGADSPLQVARLETQARFQGANSVPGWASGASGHVLWIDDGIRALGIAIGDTLDVIDPVTGSRLFVLPGGDQPGGWVSKRHYHLIKDGTSWWDLFVDGRRHLHLPYGAGSSATRSVATFGFGWQDASGAGLGYWDEVETSVDEPLAPSWKVARARFSMPAYVQARWNPRVEAIMRATVGLSHSVQDKMFRLPEEFTAAVADLQEGAFTGNGDAVANGWTVNGTVLAFSVVRERIRIAASSTPTYLQWSFTTPGNLDGVFYVAGRFLPRSMVSSDPRGRLGPYLRIFDGNRKIGAFLVADRGNPDAIGWLLSDGDPSGALGNTGDVVYRVAREHESFVELYVIGRDRVILFVDGQLVEDVPYSRFTATTAVFQARIGRDGNADLAAVVDVTDGEARLAYGDNAYRSLFLRRVAERLVFASGCERNDVLDAWLRHRHGVFAARGTDRVITEIRRLACDDEATLVTERFPGMWYLGVTYPGVTPTFISADGEIPLVHAEYRADHAPNFSPDELQKLIKFYLLPRSSQEAQFVAALVTNLVTGTSTVSGHTEFSVESALGFAADDDVTLRESTSGDLLTVQYDAGPATAADTMTVASFGGNVWADWTTSSTGTQDTEIVGTVALGGLIAQRAGVITAGSVVKVKGASGAVDAWVEVFGKETGTGLAVSERLHALGTADVVGTVQFDEVHGAICMPAAQAAIAVIGVTGATTLYTIAINTRARGAYLFDPPLFAGPLPVTAVADAATTNPIQLWGVEEGASDAGEQVALAGTTPVVSSTTWATIRVVAAGYLAAARTATLSAALVDPDGAIGFVSSSASDVQFARVYGVSVHGEPTIATIQLNGTTPVTGTPPVHRWRILGVELASPAVGTIQFACVSARPVHLATFAPGESTKGVDRRLIEAVGAVAVSLSVASTTPRFVGIIGRDEDGAAQLEILQPGTDPVVGTDSFVEVRGIATGHVPSSTTIAAAGKAWRYRTAREAIVGLADSYAWSAVGPSPDLALDGVLDGQADTDATVSVALAGVWSVSEDTTLLSVDSDTGAVASLLLDGSFSSGAVMRLKEPT